MVVREQQASRDFGDVARVDEGDETGVPDERALAAKTFGHSEEVVQHRGADVEVGHRQVAVVEDLVRGGVLDAEWTGAAAGGRTTSGVGLALRGDRSPAVIRCG